MLSAQWLNLKAQPAVARAVAEGASPSHAWYYDILTGRHRGVQRADAAASFRSRADSPAGVQTKKRAARRRTRRATERES